MQKKTAIRGGMMLAFALVAMPAAAFAQACVGTPFGSANRTAFSVGMAFPESATTFGGEVRVRTESPLTVGANYALTSIDELDPKQHTFGADAAYELPVEGASLCAVAGAGYSRISESGLTLSDFTIPVGLGLAATLMQAPDFALVPHIVPQLLWTRSSASMSGVSVSDSGTEFGVDLGLTFHMQQFLVRTGMFWTTEEDVKAAFGFSLGLLR